MKHPSWILDPAPGPPFVLITVEFKFVIPGDWAESCGAAKVLAGTPCI